MQLELHHEAFDGVVEVEGGDLGQAAQAVLPWYRGGESVCAWR